MKKAKLSVMIGMMAMLALGATAADKTVMLSDVHICCGSCVDLINETTAKVPGVKATANETAKTIVLSGNSTATLQKAVDALVAEGFYGKSSDGDIKVKAPTGAKSAPVTTLQVTEVHLCCDECVTTVTNTLAKVPGVTGSNPTADAKTFTVTGNFKPTDVFAALHKAGFSGKVAAATDTATVAIPTAGPAASAAAATK